MGSNKLDFQRFQKIHRMKCEMKLLYQRIRRIQRMQRMKREQRKAS